jgi:hypothetical protein
MSKVVSITTRASHDASAMMRRGVGKYVGDLVDPPV